MTKIKEWLAAYCATPWHQWWVKNVWKPSWTKFVSISAGLPAAVVLAGQKIGQLAGDDKVSQLLQQMHLPDGIYGIVTLVALAYYVAAGH